MSLPKKRFRLYGAIAQTCSPFVHPLGTERLLRNALIVHDDEPRHI